MLSKCFGLKNKFLGQNKLKPDFLATIVAGIWVASDEASFVSAGNASSYLFIYLLQQKKQGPSRPGLPGRPEP